MKIGCWIYFLDSLKSRVMTFLFVVSAIGHTKEAFLHQHFLSSYFIFKFEKCKNGGNEKKKRKKKFLGVVCSEAILNSISFIYLVYSNLFGVTV